MPFPSHSAGTQSALHEIPALERRELDERALTAGYPQARPFPFRFHTRTFHGHHLGDICVQLATADRLGRERLVDREASGLLTRDQDVPGGGGRAGGEGKGDEKGRVSFFCAIDTKRGIVRIPARSYFACRGPNVYRCPLPAAPTFSPLLFSLHITSSSSPSFPLCPPFSFHSLLPAPHRPWS